MPLINASMLDDTPPEWTVENVIPRVGLGILYGPSTWGKSLVADNELALAIANGTDFFGQKTVHGCAVVALGEGLYDAGVRLKGRMARQIKDDEAVLAGIEDEEERETARTALPEYTDERVFIMTQPFTIPVNQNGTPSESMKHALAQLRIIPDLELLVIDAMSDFSGGLSISNDASANRYMLGLKMLVKELDCVVLVVGHITVDGKKMIGAQRIFNASDFVIEVIPDDSGPGEPKSATLMCRKSKYGPEFAPLSYQIEPLMWTTETADGPVLIQTATVRQQGDPLSEGAATLRLPGDGPAPHRELPEVSAVPRRRKRNGVRSEPLIPPTATMEDLAERARQALARLDAKDEKAVLEAVELPEPVKPEETVELPASVEPVKLPEPVGPESPLALVRRQLSNPAPDPDPEEDLLQGWTSTEAAPEETEQAA